MRSVLTILFLTIITSNGVGQTHPLLLLNREDVAQVKKGIAQYPLLKLTYESVKAEVDIALTQPIQVPVPKDLAGGYSHEQHKKNYLTLQKAGVIYQLTSDEKYA